MNYRNLITVVLSASLPCVLFAGGQDEIGADKSADALEFTMVYHDTGIEFGQVIRTGAMAAADAFGVRVNFVGPIGIDVDEQVNFIENAITAQVDGLAISNVNGEALNPMIEKAIAAGIPVVTFNSEAPGGRRIAFYGQDLVESGREQGRILVEYMGTAGNVLIVTGEAQASWSQDRERGVRAALADYPDIEIIGVLSTGWEEQQQYAAIENALLANPDLTGIASLGAPTGMSTGRALLRNDRKQIVHIAHDFMPETLDNIKAGATEASLSQNPYQQGYLPIEALYQYVTNGRALESVDTGILRADASNVDEYLDRLDQGEPVG